MNTQAYLASRSTAERTAILKNAGRVGVGRHHAGTAGSSICPPRDMMATRRYKLPTRREIFTHAQQYGDTVQALIPDTHVRPLN